MLNAASVNDQLSQDKRPYIENFQKGRDNRIEGFEDGLFVFANSKDVKRNDYKVSLLNEWKDEAPQTAVHKGPPTTPSQTSSSSSSSGKMSPIPVAQAKGYKVPPPAKPLPPAKILVKETPSTERYCSLTVTPVSTAFWDSFVRMMLEIIQEARTCQYVIEECAEPYTRFTVAEQVAAIEVHMAITQWSATLDKRLGIN